MAISTYSTSLTITGKKGSDTTDTSTTVPIYDFPDMGSDPETIDVTTLGNDQYVYIAGIKGSSSLTFNANYDADVFDELDKRTKPQTCVLKLQDNHTLTWTGTISVRIAGGGVNEKVSMAITIVPSTAAKDRNGTVVPIYDFPDMGSDPETIDVTTLGDSQYVYIAGIKGSSALTFNANYDATTFGNLNSMSGTKKCFLTLQDGCYLSWEGTVSVRIAGGGVNEKVAMAITIVPSKEISYHTKPAAG